MKVWQKVLGGATFFDSHCIGLWLKLCFVFRWMSVLERVVNLELPPEEEEIDTPCESSTSSEPSLLKPADISSASTTELSEETDDQENIYETINT